jgi:uracil-DNA glycosylase
MSALTELYEQIKACHKCEISRERTNAVPGEGPENAEIMFIGEAPGWNEDKQGRPFCGQAGQFLDKLLTSINLDRKKVYITNVIKTRPPDNRDPAPMEIQNCAPWLDKQLEIIKPKMIVTLGRYSMAKFFPGKSISKIHGTAEKKDGIIYFAMYHPAAALHQGNLRQVIEEDIKKIPKILAENNNLQPEKPKPVEQPVKQLNMFE